MVKVETHNGSTYGKIAEAAYDGEGNRARLVAWAGSTPLTTTYTYQLVEWTQVLQAKTGVSTTTYLYGVNPIGEFGSQSVYYLADGAGSVRQLADPNGAVVLSRWYEPFGQVLTQKGTAVATYGYLGVQLDRVTGLVYVNGRYYDPVTGRFLTPSGGQNPYVPLPISASLLGPLMVLSAVAQRHRKRRKWFQVLLVVLVLLAAGGMLVSCNPPPTPTPPDNQQPAPTQPSTPGRTPGRQTPSPVPTTPGSSRTPPPPVPCPTPKKGPTSTSTMTPSPTPPTPNCTARPGEPYCINPAVDDLRTMVAHVLYQEGGSTIGPDAMRNISLVIRNRVGVPEFAPTILGVISQGNGIHFNGWYAPSARESGFYWPQALEIADLLIGGGPLGASEKMTNKTRYFCSCQDRKSELPGDSDYVHHDEGGGRAQYYYEHLPNPLSCVPTTQTPKP